VWSIKSFPGGKEYVLRASFLLPSVEAEDAHSDGRHGNRMPPIKVKFEIPYFTVSGIQVGRIVPMLGAIRAYPMLRAVVFKHGNTSVKTLTHHTELHAGLVFSRNGMIW
jgi:hypothetical protein